MGATVEKKARSETWHEGYDAYHNGVSVNDNPHLSSGKGNACRIDWFSGWYDAMHQERWPDWLEF